MKTQSWLGKRIYEADVFDNILLTNNIGGFYTRSTAPFSRYNGFFFNENMELYKTIESIRLLPDENTTQVINRFHSIEVKRKSLSTETTEQIFVLDGKNAIYFEHDSKKQVEISLDCRKAYDGQVFGRYYDIFVEDGAIIIKYTKKKDSTENRTDGQAGRFEDVQYEIYSAIIADNLEFKKTGKWYDQFYPFDFERNETSQRGIYQAITLDATRMAVGFSTKKDKAILEAKTTYSKKQELFENKSKRIDDIKHKKIKDPSLDFAYLTSMNAMHSFLVYDEKNSGSAEPNDLLGLYAGYPWFFQFWTRDSALSSKALFLTGKIDEAKKILMNYLKNVREDGWLLNRIPHADLDSADACGLVFFRLSNLIDYLEDKEELSKYFSEEELKHIKITLEDSIYASLKNHSQNEFIVNKKKETWMDTDFREGVRVEIQALQLFMYSFLRKLSKRQKDKIAYEFALHQEKTLLKKVKSQMFDEYLLDGLGDKTIRPNIFLAYYIYPNLLSKKEWMDTFDAVIPALWLDWGGLSTIDKSHPEFQKRHTGSNDKSYHKGDSWYFLNNLAAISMYRLDAEKYKLQIDKILEASTNEILNRGILGFHAEVSSAEVQESKGCQAQAWSSAFYIELVREVLESNK